MIVVLLFGFFAMIAMLTLFLLQSDPAEKPDNSSEDDITAAGRRSGSRWTRLQWQRNASGKKPILVSEKVILAMARRGDYKLKVPGNKLSKEDDGGEYGRWARDFLASLCHILDEPWPNALALEQIIDAYCDRIERVCKQYQTRLDEYNKILGDIAEVRSLLQHEVYGEYRCMDEEEPVMAMTSCRNWPAYQTVKSQCPVLPITTNTDEEYFMSVCKQFLTDNTVGRTITCNKECPSTAEPDEDVESAKPSEPAHHLKPAENQKEDTGQAS